MEILKKALKLASALTVVSFVRADQLISEQFDYLNNNESPVIIAASKAQDLLNVDITPGGLSVKKRAGYGLYKTLATSQAIHGGHHFFDASGNDVQVWGSSTSLWGMVNDATPTQLVSSGTLNATWDCADSQGFAYCVNTSRNALIRTNGATITWFSSPLGTMAAITPDRLLIAGVAANTSTLYFSEAANFSNFVVGNAVVSPFTEVIGAPGSRITHIEYACSRILWWKDQSFGYILGTDQTNLQIVTVSNTIGTTDNSSAVDPNGSVYFRGQEGHLYRYDCSNIEKLSVDISPNVQGSGQRTSNSYSLNTQTDFQTGTIVPTTNLSTTISPGDVIVSSFAATQSSSSTWSTGTSSNVTVNPSSVTLVSNNVASVANNDFESGTVNTSSVNNWTFSVGAGQLKASTVVSGCTRNPQSGTRFINWALNETGFSASVEIIDAASSATLVTKSLPTTDTACAWVSDSISASGFIGRRVKVRFHVISAGSSTNETLTTDSSFILGGDISFYRALQTRAIPDAAISSWQQGFDNVQNGSSTITTGSFTSLVFNTSFTSATYQVSTFTYVANSSTPTFTLQTSTSATGIFTTLINNTTGSNAIGNQYARYVVTINVGSNDTALSSFSQFSFFARSSGTFYTPVRNAPNISTWDTFNATTIDNGGTHTFYMRSSTSPFSVLSATPSWTAQASGAVIGIATGTYFQMRDDFAITAATNTPTLSDIAANWFEGSASDKAYGIYFKDAVWWSVAFGAGQSTNNYIFKYDLLHPGWTLYNFGANGFAIQNNHLYFGSTAADGRLFRYGEATSDNGTAITAYYKSKDFTGADPWLENEYTQIDTFVRRNTGQTLTTTYALNASTTTTSFNISLTNTTDDNIRWKKLLPAGKIGGVFNIQYGDTSTTSQWELLGFRVVFKQLPYRPSQP